MVSKNEMKRNKPNLGRSLNLMAKSAVVVFIGIFLAKLLGYAYRVIIARYFGAETYGIYSLAIMVLGLFVTFSFLGIGKGLVKYIPVFRGKNQTSNIQSIFRSSYILLSFTSIAAGIILFVFAKKISLSIFHEPNLVIFLQLFSFAVPLSVFFSLFISVLLAYEKIGWHTFISDFLLNFLKVLALAILIFAGLNSNAIIYSYLIGTLVVVFVIFYVMKKQIPEIFHKSNLKNKERSKLFRELFSFSWPLLLSGFIWNVFEWADTFFIGYFRTSAEVGFYNAAMPIALFLFIPAFLFAKLFYPLINKEYHRGNRDLVDELTKQVAKWILLLSFPLFTLILLFPGSFINILFGEEFLVAEKALIYLSIGFMFTSVFSISGYVLLLLEKSKNMLYSTLSVFILNIILNVILIPRFGITGAAISTTISIIALYTILTAQAYHYTKIIPLRRKMLTIVASSFVSAVILILVKSKVTVISPISLAVLLVLFAALYVIFLLLFKGLDKNDFAVIKSSIRKIKSKR